MIRSVSIVGCGWFGFPLAKALVKAGLMVRGSKRTEQQAALLEKEGITGFNLDLDTLDDATPLSRLMTESMLDSDCLVVNIPPGFRHDPDAYLRRLSILRDCVSQFQYQRIVFISSTGVYPANTHVVVEKDAKNHSIASEHLLAAELVFGDIAPTCVLRFAGLVGPKRHPGRFLSGKKDIDGAASPVNLVHLNDCVRAVTHIIFADEVQCVYNLCAQEHPSRKALYQAASMDLGLTMPVFNQVEQAGKRVDGRLITRDLGFEYQFTDPIEMLKYC